MGLYDIFYLEIKCPKCGREFKDYAQTKSLYCEMKDYRIGDPIEWPNDEIFVYSYCSKCGKTLFQGVRIENGFVKETTVAYLKDELPDGLDRFFGEIYFPSDVAEYLKGYRYEEAMEKKKDEGEDKTPL